MKKITLLFLILGLTQLSFSQSYKNFNCSTLLVPETNDCSVASENTTIDTDNNTIEIRSDMKSASEFNLNLIFADGSAKNQKVPATATKDDIVTLSNATGFEIIGMQTRAVGNIDYSYGDSCVHTGAKVVTTFSFTSFADDNTLEQASATININPNGALGDPSKYLSSTWTINVVYDASLSYKKLDYYGFTFSPNPAGNTLNLSANDNISNVELYNTLGQKAISKNINALNTSLDLTHLQKGIYLMKATINNKTATYRIVKE